MTATSSAWKVPNYSTVHPAWEDEEYCLVQWGNGGLKLFKIAKWGCKRENAQSDGVFTCLVVSRPCLETHFWFDLTRWVSKDADVYMDCR